MKLFKILSYIVLLSFYSTISFSSDSKEDCSKIKADTGVKMYQKWKCQESMRGNEGLGKKLKNFFIKKN